MQNSLNQLEQLEALLEREHVWPGEYRFKFIVKRADLEYATSILGQEGLSIRESESGKYVSLTIIKVMQSSKDVIAVYKKASVIPGLIAL